MPRRDTKELILATSLSLFNDFGEPNVTTNHIADEADISPGNLHYHFRRKDDIVIALFKRFLARFQPLTEIPEDVLLSAEDLWFQLHLGFELKGEYRFLYRNLSDITARVPDIDRAMRALLARERASAINSLSGLEQGGVLTISAVEKELLVQNLQLAMTYWIPFADVDAPNSLEDGSAQVFAIARVLMMAAPYVREPERTRLTDIAYEYLSRLM